MNTSHSYRFYFYLFLVIIIVGSCSDNSTNPNVTPKQTINFVSIPTGERIIFNKVNSIYGADIFSMKSDGTDVIQHTNMGPLISYADNPELSYDGKHLTFTSNFDSWRSCFYIDIFMLDLTTNQVHRVSGDERPVPPTSWGELDVVAPGNQFRVSAKGSSSVIYGSGVLNVPAGENIWVKAEYSNLETYISSPVRVSAGGAQIVDLTAAIKGSYTASYGFPTSDGRFVVGICTNQLAFWDSYKGILVDKYGGQVGVSLTPSISHDGSKLVYGMGLGGLADNLAYINLNSTDSFPHLILSPPIGSVYTFSSPSWTPDDQIIAFCLINDNGSYPTCNILYYDFVSQKISSVTNLSGLDIAIKPTISPDGNKVAYTKIRMKSMPITMADYLVPQNFQSADIYVFDATTSQETRMTFDGKSYNPSWGIVKK